jgi:hypothetical protein
VSRKNLSQQEKCESVARASSTESIICSPMNLIVPAMIPDQDQAHTATRARNNGKDKAKEIPSLKERKNRESYMVSGGDGGSS